MPGLIEATFSDLLEELRSRVLEGPTKQASAQLLFSYAVGVALAAGITLEQIRQQLGAAEPFGAPKG